ncbi:PLDc N-terminal domain-containing protein [Leucobacter sp. cx-42]|uniref:PLDc N-terminal domain-containing protein n=1 Tax=unclassified Leucobacter TaxID=2621730 RepID=UPI00165DAFD1|nr:MULTISPECIES: PLDc N-terminal domain-containing protein [unclassified Leucobacter]MBC9954013.1 PLDc N-terminal domain-containing protein [Leucobacter sp. cx-42]
MFSVPVLLATLVPVALLLLWWIAVLIDIRDASYAPLSTSPEPILIKTIWVIFVTIVPLFGLIVWHLVGRKMLIGTAEGTDRPPR